MSSKKKSMSILVIVMAVLLFVVAIVSVVAIWAAKRQTFSSNINVKYTAQSVTGSASARWKVGSEDWQPMTSSSGEETVTFDSQANENATLSPDDIILTEQNPFVVFEYQFTNTGTKPYTVDMFWQNGLQENISVYTVNTTTAIADDMLKDEIDTGFADFFSTTVEENNGTTYLYILAEITIPGIDSTYTGSFQFDLDGKNHAADFEFDNGTITGLKDGVSTTTLHIPSEIDGTPVTTIAAGSFVDLTEVTLVAIPDSVNVEQGAFQFTDAQLKPKLKYLQMPLYGDNIYASYIFGGEDYTYNERKQYFPSSIKNLVVTGIDNIGESAFDGCQNVKRISIPGAVNYINRYAFRRCTQLDNFIVPKDTDFINAETFYACSNLTSVDIPGGEADEKAFYNCKALKYVRILHYHVYFIGPNAFNGCNNLSAIYFEDTLQVWCENDFTFDVALNQPTQLLTTATNAVPRKLYVMENGEYHRVSGSVTIPQGTTKINAMAFCGLSDISEIVIPDSVTDIGRQAFNKCEGLVRVRYNGTLDQWIENSLTYSNSITGQTYLLDKDHPRQLYIKGRLLKNAEIDAGNVEISQYAFSNLPDLTQVTISSGITEIGGRAFQNCTGLTTVSIPGSVATIGASAFQGCTNLANLTLNDGITEIAGSAFRECGITGTLTIPDSVTTIAAAAFQDCTKMENVKLPKDLNVIEKDTFRNCTSLTGPLTLPPEMTIWENAFDGCSSLSGALNFSGADTEIHENAFNDCSSLESLSIYELIEIYSRAFNNCTGLKSIYIGHCSGGDYSFLADDIFLNCSGLTSIIVDDIGSNCYTSQNSAGEECNVIVRKSDKTLILGCSTSTIPDDVETIGINAFYGCTNLTHINIPTSVLEIRDGAFEHCSGLTEVNLPENVRIDEAAFLGCGLVDLVIPQGAYLCSLCFQSCFNLESVTISSGVRLDADSYSQFYLCEKLNSLIIEDSSFYHSYSSYDDSSLTPSIESGETVKILDSIDDGSNTYLNENFTKSTEKEQIGNKYYWVYTKN